MNRYFSLAGGAFLIALPLGFMISGCSGGNGGLIGNPTNTPVATNTPLATNTAIPTGNATSAPTTGPTTKPTTAPTVKPTLVPTTKPIIITTFHFVGTVRGGQFLQNQSGARDFARYIAIPVPTSTSGGTPTSTPVPLPSPTPQTPAIITYLGTYVLSNGDKGTVSISDYPDSRLDTGTASTSASVNLIFQEPPIETGTVKVSGTVSSSGSGKITFSNGVTGSYKLTSIRPYGLGHR